jgi:hypothetical protein
MDVQNTPAFSRWFDQSVVVDSRGKPLVVFHGTPMSFDSFYTFPIFFTDDSEAAAGYAQDQYAPPQNPSGPNVIPVYLSLQRPKVMTAKHLHRLIAADASDIHSIEWSDFDRLAERFEHKGHDGVIITGVSDYVGGTGPGRVWRAYTQFVAFKPEQIKSAIGNRGTFDPSTANFTL